GYAGAGITTGSANSTNKLAPDPDPDNIMIEEEDDLLTGPATKEKKKKGRRNFWLVTISIIGVVVMGLVLFAYLRSLSGDPNKTDVNVRDASKQNPTAAVSDQQITAQAID